MNKYQIAHKVYLEHLRDYTVPDECGFDDWLKDKEKRYPLKEKWHELCHWVFESDICSIHDDKAFAKFLEIFKGEKIT